VVAVEAAVVAAVTVVVAAVADDAAEAGGAGAEIGRLRPGHKVERVLDNQPGARRAESRLVGIGNVRRRASDAALVGLLAARDGEGAENRDPEGQGENSPGQVRLHSLSHSRLK